MTTEQKNYLLVARFYLEHRNDPAGLELWLKRRRQNPDALFINCKSERAFKDAFVWSKTKEDVDFWLSLQLHYEAWYNSLPERQPEPKQPSFEEEDAEMAQVMKRVYESREKEKQLPIEFREWLASVEAKNPEHAKFFRENFSQYDWDSLKIEPHPGVRGVDPKASTYLLTVYKDSGNVWRDLRKHYPYPIPAPREIPFSPEEATEGRFLVDKSGGTFQILFTNGKIWVYKNGEGASLPDTWEEISENFDAITE